MKGRFAAHEFVAARYPQYDIAMGRFVVREFAAVGLRTGCELGCYACARIAEEIERWV